jgi:hypothetical protein
MITQPWSHKLSIAETMYQRFASLLPGCFVMLHRTLFAVILASEPADVPSVGRVDVEGGRDKFVA